MEIKKFHELYSVERDEDIIDLSINPLRVSLAFFMNHDENCPSKSVLNCYESYRCAINAPNFSVALNHACFTSSLKHVLFLRDWH